VVASAWALAECGGGPKATTAGDGSCTPDVLKTGIVAQQTGVSADAYDCQILKWTAHFKEPDPMIFKAIIYNESRFDENAVACPNLPCGTPMGWTAAESGCYGLMQVVPACGGATNQPCLLPNGHPNLTKAQTSAAWLSSVFNPDVNVEIGIGGFADNRSQVVMQFPGCTEEQYTLMALGNYANYGSTKSCTVYNTDYTSLVLTTYHQYAAAAGYVEHPYP
jgi:hypothetical protein